MNVICMEAIKRIEAHKERVKQNVLLNSQDYDLDSAVKDAIAPYDVCINIIKQAASEGEE